MESETPEPKQRPVRLADGSLEIVEDGPIVIVGPNGSGKTRQSRTLRSDVQISVINALRNTRISQTLQPMAVVQAKQNLAQIQSQIVGQPYELANDFDIMFTAVLAEASEVSMRYLRGARKEEQQVLPPPTAIELVQELWCEFFPGRELVFEDYNPVVINTNNADHAPARYTAWQMSDGEKAALYLAGRALSAEQNAVLLVDEPETHFHSLLAVQFWDAIERSRPDLRIIYVTHDMTFAASRRATQYLLCDPKDGLQPIALDETASEEVAALMLGTASLSFYAKRIIFCEGEKQSYDARLYGALLADKETIVRAVGSSDMVMRCVSSLRASNVIQNLEVRGIVDRDFHPDALLAGLPEGVVAPLVHEVESYFAIPEVVEAVARHNRRALDRKVFEAKLRAIYAESDRDRVAIERWKRRAEGQLVSLVAGVSGKNDSVAGIVTALPAVFDQTSWTFSPAQMLEEESRLVQSAFDQASSTSDLVLRLMPGKQLISLAASEAGMTAQAYTDLVINSLEGGPEDKLGTALRTAFKTHLPL